MLVVMVNIGFPPKCHRNKSVANFDIDLYQIIVMNIMHILVFGKSLYIVAVDLLEALEQMIRNHL